MDNSSSQPLVTNRYRLLERIGEGAMGKVYKAIDVRLGRRVSLKFLSQNLVNEKMCDRFETEARIAAQLCQQSDHIISVTDFGVDEQNTPFYVMEYLWGNSLRDLFATVPLPLPRFLHLIRQVCWGLQVAHQGILVKSQPELVPIVHRDIKPSNVFVCPDEQGGERVKILDFGISELLRPESEPVGQYMGTLAYSSPEQLEGEKLDPRSDIYSLGVMMFEMLTQKLPVQVASHGLSAMPAWYQAHRQQVPLSLEFVSERPLPRSLTTMVMSCLAKKAGDRPQSVAQILRVLEPLVTQHPFEPQQQHTARPAQTPAADSRPRRRQTHPTELPATPEALNQPVWLPGMPVGRIVVPRPVSTPGSSLPALWVMLPHEEIRSIQINSMYNSIFKHALFCQSPHPMILWVTALLNKRQEGRWFPAFLDMKATQSNEIVRALIQNGGYQILFFDLEPPHYFVHCIETRLKPEQYSAFRQWVLTSRTLSSVGRPRDSQTLLRQAYQQIRQRVEVEGTVQQFVGGY